VGAKDCGHAGEQAHESRCGARREDEDDDELEDVVLLADVEVDSGLREVARHEFRHEVEKHGHEREEDLERERGQDALDQLCKRAGK
jgi:hypothetical protein